MNWSFIGIGFVILFSLGIGFWWQSRMFEKEGSRSGFPLCLLPPTVAFTIWLCYMAFIVYATCDMSLSINRQELWIQGGILLLLAIVFSLKSFFAPVVFGVSLSIASYQLLQHGTFNPVILFNLTSEIFLSWAPSWVQQGYSVLSFVSCLGIAVNGLLSDGLIEKLKSLL